MSEKAWEVESGAGSDGWTVRSGCFAGLGAEPDAYEYIAFPFRSSLESMGPYRSFIFVQRCSRDKHTAYHTSSRSEMYHLNDIGIMPF